MGTPESASVPRMMSEAPVHRVCVAAFHLGRHELTQAQYRAVMGTNPASRKGSALPVEMLAHPETVRFFDKLRAMTGRPYRLPTEAEWEYACRAGSERLYPWGDRPGESAAHAWTSANSDERTHDVGQKRPNAFGFHDMLGNVWEWCADHAYEDSAGAPVDGSARADAGSLRWVMRGGAVDITPETSRPGARATPTFMLHTIGFRVALSTSR
jgi:formylglycine-generating enzyme required for sulfatase activity